MIITSKQNAKIKEIKSLQQKKFRILTKKYLVEGVKMIKDALSCGEDVETIVTTPKTFACFEDYKSLSDRIITVSDEVFSYLSLEVNPQGVIAVVKKKEKEIPYAKDSVLLLDRVSDPGNLGTIIRTAAASGYKDIYLLNCVDAFNPKTVRASMSGIFHVNLNEGGEELLSFIDLPMISADMSGESVFEFCPPKAFCLVIGNEANGISDRVKNLSKYTVKIPMENTVESLNAGVAAGILMYALKNKAQ